MDNRYWECKECNKQIEAHFSVAFHLVDGFLYGWCRTCFEAAQNKRNKLSEL